MEHDWVIHSDERPRQAKGSDGVGCAFDRRQYYVARHVALPGQQRGGQQQGPRQANHQCRDGQPAGAFVAVPDVTGFYGPGVPLTLGLAALLFVAGALWSVHKRRFIPILWILLTILLGGFLLTGAPSSSRYTVSIPAICWLIAMPLNWLIEKGQRYLALGLLVVVVMTDLLFYFAVYVPSAPVDLIHSFPPGPFP